MKETTLYFFYYLDEALHVIHAIDAIGLSEQAEIPPNSKFAALKMLRNRMVKAYRNRFNSEDKLQFAFPANRKDELIEDLSLAKKCFDLEQVGSKSLLQREFWLHQEAWIDDLGGYVRLITAHMNL